MTPSSFDCVKRCCWNLTYFGCRLAIAAVTLWTARHIVALLRKYHHSPTTSWCVPVAQKRRAISDWFIGVRLLFLSEVYSNLSSICQTAQTMLDVILYNWQRCIEIIHWVVSKTEHNKLITQSCWRRDGPPDQPRRAHSNPTPSRTRAGVTPQPGSTHTDRRPPYWPWVRPPIRNNIL